MLKLISFNAAILDIRLLGYSLYRPVDDIKTRLSALTDAIKSSKADVIFLQELFHRKNQLQLFHHLKSEYPYICGVENSGWGLRLGNELIVLSRHPLSGAKLTRFTHAPAEELRHTSKGFLHLKATLPTLGTIDLINFHMSAGGKHAHPESAAMEAIRKKQIEQLISYCKPLSRVLLGGDLNAGPDTSEDNYNQLIGAGFYDLSANDEFSWDPTNILVQRGTDAPLPAQRIDHIFVNNELFSQLQAYKGYSLFRENCVKTDSHVIPLSDHYGVAVDILFDSDQNP